MSQGLSKGERPSWSTPGRAGASVMDRVADSASAHRAKRMKRARPAAKPRGKR